MLNKYYVSIENKTTNDITIYIIKTMYNKYELMQQLKRMYNEHIIIVRFYNYMYDTNIKLLNLKNTCVAHNVQCYNL